MNIKTLVAALVLSSSSLASAQSFSAGGAVTISSSASFRSSARDHRGAPAVPVSPPGRPLAPAVRLARSSGMPAAEPVGVVLAHGLVVSPGETRKFLDLNDVSGRFRSVQFDASSGPIFIKQIRINFTDGSYRLVRDIDVALRAGAGLSVDIEGRGRRIEGLVVYARSGGSGGSVMNVSVI